MFSEKFVAATREYCTIEKHIPAPCMRKNFILGKMPREAKFTVCGLGYYRLFVNGREITRSYLSSYTANPDDVLYYDEYDIKEYVRVGKNVVAVLLGNGFLNCICGGVWEFDKAEYRSAPKVAFALDIDGVVTEADESVKTFPSAITFDDLRGGEKYDANLEQEGWTEAEFDDSNWRNAIGAETPKGEARIAQIEPITVEREIVPVSVVKSGDGYLYDFGYNTAGIARLSLNAKAGQRLKLYFCEIAIDGKADLRNIGFAGRTLPDYCQCIEYTCKEGKNVYEPSFCYMGFRYIFVSGFTEEQAKKDALTMLKMHTAVKNICSFSCSDERVNKIYANAVNSALSNLYHFPTDCPQREKNGWTADAALSAEMMLLNFDCEKVLREWLFNIRKRQLKTGQIPCIVPTSGWGYGWGSGPAWDFVLTELPYRIYRMTGHKEAIYENADAIFAYINYMEKRRNERGLTEYGLGDWCETDLFDLEKCSAPLCVTDTLICMETCRQASELFRLIEEKDRAEYCENLYRDFLACFRRECVDENMTVLGSTQTGQAMALYYGAFTEKERDEAFAVLKNLIKEKNDHFQVGVLGGRVLFRVLSDFGEYDLAHRLIVQPTFPSYAYHLNLGATSLFEAFYELNEKWESVRHGWVDAMSLNHHFWGDVAAFFVEYIAGLRIVCAADGMKAEIAPCPIGEISWARAERKTERGTLSVEWKKTESVWEIRACIPKGIKGVLRLPDGEEKLSPGEQICRISLKNCRWRD